MNFLVIDFEFIYFVSCRLFSSICQADVEVLTGYYNLYLECFAILGSGKEEGKTWADVDRNSEQNWGKLTVTLELAFIGG